MKKKDLWHFYSVVHRCNHSVSELLVVTTISKDILTYSCIYIINFNDTKQTSKKSDGSSLIPRKGLRKALDTNQRPPHRMADE